MRKAVSFGDGFSPPSDSPCMEVAVLKEKYFSFAQTVGYTESTWKNTVNDWAMLQTAMKNAGITEYSPYVGSKYLQLRKQSVKCCKSEDRLIYVLDCIVENKRILRKAPPIAPSVPEAYLPVYNDYIGACVQNGNKKQTIMHKKRYTRYFLTNLHMCGCDSLADLTPELVLQASREKVDSGCWSNYRRFLSFLADTGRTDYDYSSLVPKNTNELRLPDVYSKEEILQLEASIDRTTPAGKRDYAIILIASRLSLRNSDIAGLVFDSVDFDNDSLHICQKKTEVYLELPLLPEVKEALTDYIENARPESDEPYIFLRINAPCVRIADSTVYAIIHKAFERSGIDGNGRASGGRSLRSSGATHKVNSGVPYSLVRKSLGHASENAIQHYARVDVESLRRCAISPPGITKGSSFAAFLGGDTSWR